MSEIPTQINPLSSVKLSKHAKIGGTAKDHCDKLSIVSQLVKSIKDNCGDLAPLKGDPSFLQYVVSQVLNMANKSHDIEAIVIQVMGQLFNLNPIEQDAVKMGIKFLMTNKLAKKTGILGKLGNYAKKKVGLF
jgi:hypothetical protein